MKERKPIIEGTMLNYLKHNPLPGFDMVIVQRSVGRTPKIGFAISGGGYRSMLTGAGFLMAFDLRTPGATLLGGLFESSSYVCGTSGGAWTVIWVLLDSLVALYAALFESADLSEPLIPGIPEIESEMEKNLLDRPETDENIFAKLGAMIFLGAANSVDQVSSSLSMKLQKVKTIIEFYSRLHQEVKAKKAQGCYTSFTDYWSRALCNQLFDKGDHHVKTFSSLVEGNSFKARRLPFPLINAIQKQPSTISRNHLLSHNMEINPYEFGSWESHLNGFIKTKYLGSNVTNGDPVTCVNGYDNVCFLTATSSSLFNEISLVIFKLLAGAKSEIGTAIEMLLGLFGLNRASWGSATPGDHSDHAIFSPNPFYQWDGACQAVKENPHLYLVDGGDDGQNVPFIALLQPCRELDVIFAIDSSSDKGGYPNATSLVHTAQRLHNPRPYFDQPAFSIAGNTRSYFPLVPYPNEPTDVVLRERAVFLGCDVEHDYPEVRHNKTVIAAAGNLPPLIVYFANREVACRANTPTFKLSYNQTEKQCLMRNGFEIATERNATSFANCMKCATFKRHFDRLRLGITPSGTATDVVPRICKECFTKYCWRDRANDHT